MAKAPTADPRVFRDALARGESIGAACQATGISRQTWYDWKRKVDEGDASPEVEDFVRTALGEDASTTDLDDPVASLDWKIHQLRKALEKAVTTGAPTTTLFKLLAEAERDRKKLLEDVGPTDPASELRRLADIAERPDTPDAILVVFVAAYARRHRLFWFHLEPAEDFSDLPLADAEAYRARLDEAYRAAYDSLEVLDGVISRKRLEAER